MAVDPFRLAIALVPVASYMLLLGLLNLRRRPFLTSGGCDLAALGVALSGLMFFGPMELFRPEAATRSFGNYIWLFLLLFYYHMLLLVYYHMLYRGVDRCDHRYEWTAQSANLQVPAGAVTGYCNRHSPKQRLKRGR